MLQKINVLAYATHPDDAEISISGTLLKHQSMGLKTGIIDLTQGELGTRGSKEIRASESKISSEILKLSVRENLKLADGFFEINNESLLLVVETLRAYQPDVVLINAEKDRHPDHGRGHELLKRACFLSGLSKIETFRNNILQAPWRPKSVFSYIQDHFLEPDILIDVSDFWQLRMESLLAYSSQFYNPNSAEPETPISGASFLQTIEGRAIQLGRTINVKYAEGLRKVTPIKVENLFDILPQ